MGNKNITIRMVESEKLIEKKLGQHVRRLGGLSVKLLPTITGIPDRVCLLPGGRLFFAEIKTTGQRPRKIQKIIINKLRCLGFDVWVIDSTEKIKIICKTYTQ